VGFELTISVAETTLPQGENFRVTVELTNNSGEDHEIAYSFLFIPRVSGGNRPPFTPPWPPPRPNVYSFENGSTISGTISLDWDYDLLPGVYQLNVSSGFYIGWEQPDASENERLTWDDIEGMQRISVWSNTIVITVK
jgi:hypothetical protein